MNGMSDLIDDRPVVPPRRVFTAGRYGRVVRGAGFLVLVLAALTVIPSLSPPWRPVGDLTGDLAAGRVNYVEYQANTATVRWVVDYVRWRQADINSPPPGVDNQAPWQNRGEVWLEQQIAASGSRVRLNTATDDRPGVLPLRVPWAPLRYAAIAVWLLTLVNMLSRGGHRVANRWAWLWMFTIGQIGAALYLLREPVPLWRSEVVDSGRAPIRGGFGFLYAIGLSIVAGLVGTGIALLLR
jgi:hypothetical protein